MTILWMNLVVVFGYALFARYFASPSYAIAGVGEQFSGAGMVKPNKILVLGSLTALVVSSGLRSNLGDTYYYMHAYESNEFTWAYILTQKDIGFGALQMFLQNYISEDPQVLVFTTALITNMLILIVFYNYSRLLEISLYVYITGGLFLVSMNGIRQMFAAAIAFTAIKFLIQGSFFKYALVIILASLFHQSALVLLPIYFLMRFKAWSKPTLALIVLSVIVVIGFEQFSALLFSALEDSQYGHYQDFQEGGANFLRVVVMGVPILIAYLGREKLREIFPESDVIVNMALLGFIFMIIATQNWIFARVSLYFELYNIILISWVVKVFRERDQKIIYLGIIVCYFAYYYFENVINLNIIYNSDYLM
ncbi:transmembrane protein EpsG [Lentibacillus persicus]|uniref:Transmembrane protein EpsG n=1 Tax=Lentibacillus persicus TaxID=640948 RepID=A0A1I1UCH2_9BACI|nr:EpsG family protein [Lentibacillus persicus]SFD67278.1 transmembrane protein EpsG [Lentibacillus persicus]